MPQAARDRVLEAFDAVSGSALFMLDPDGRLDWASARCAELFARLSSRGQGEPDRDPEERTHPGGDGRQAHDSGGLPEAIVSALDYARMDLGSGDDRAEAAPMRIAVLRIDERPYRLYRARLEDGRSACALRDASEEEQLSRTKHEIVANISHDLRTPLTSIGLLVDRLLRSEDAHPHLYRAAATRISEQLRVLEGLADDLVALNRLDSGRALLRLKPESLDDIVMGLIESIHPQSEARAVEIVADIDAGLRVLVDRSQVERVLRNLLDNALHASRDGGRIRIGAHFGDEAGMVEVFVEDQGDGIPEQDLDRVFIRFFRGDVARTRPGTGLGLAIARHIVEGHGGSIRAENRPAPNRGAVLRFTLVAADEARAGA